MNDLRKDVCHYEDLPLTLSVEELMPILGIGRNTAYALVAQEKFAAFMSDESCGSQKRL